MREILFKAKRVDNGEWVEGSIINNAFVKNNGSACVYVFSPSEQFDSFDCLGEGVDIIEVDPETVCQFTGLLDKNGKKIFEGDIAKLKHCTAHYTCTWAHEAACFYWQCNVTSDHSNMHHEAEIIGNIHDKKENNNGN